ncbi:hypothetical protein RJ55_07020 [Drechmeria coniospora]|nr:hypothetical protein RJ55_07020 [Drechmeria coniospora]
MSFLSSPHPASAGRGLDLRDSLKSDNPAYRKSRPRANVLVCILVALLVLLGLREPVSRHYRHVSDRICQRYMAVEKRARRILTHNPLIDGHVDLAIAIRGLYRNRIDSLEWLESFKNGTLAGHVDLARLRLGQSGGAFWSVFAPCPAKADDFSDENLAPSVQFTLDQIDVTRRVLQAFPRDFALRPDSECAMKAFKNGRLISPLGIEGLHQIGNSASNLRLFHGLGVRYATLTHNCHNLYADAALSERPLSKAKPHWGGVSPHGRKMIHEMNRLGMIVDLAHVSDDTMVDVLAGKDGWEGSKAPVIFSHSSAYSICPHPRNVKDHVLRLVKQRNSLVLVNVSPDFISCEDVNDPSGLPKRVEENATLEQVVKHITYIGNLIGFDHVGLGTDFDGIQLVPKGFEDVAKYPSLVAALLKAGVSDSDAAKVVGRNLLRIWKEVEDVSAQMRAAGAPVLEDEREVP